MDRCKISIWEVVYGVPDRTNISCLMHDNRLCQLDVKLQITSTEPKRYYAKPVMM